MKPGKRKNINMAKKKIAYLLLVHQNPNQTKRLFRAIYHPDNLYFINLDGKMPRYLRQKIARDPLMKEGNVYLTEKELAWADWNLVQIVLDTMEQALNLDQDWEHFINLSGQDFPLRGAAEIQEELAAAAGKSFFDAQEISPENYEADLFLTITEESGKKIRLDEELPDIRFHKGSQWFIASREFCRYAIDSLLSRRLQKILNKAFAPDETFFQTLAGNWEESSSIVWDNKRLIDWSSGESHPITFKSRRYRHLIASSAYFARKFDSWTDNRIIKKLEKRLAPHYWPFKK